MAIFTFTRALGYVEHRVGSIELNLIVYYALISFTVRVGDRVSSLLGKNRCEYIVLGDFLLVLRSLALCCYDFITIMLGRKLKIIKITISFLLDETEYFDVFLIISRFNKGCSSINDLFMIRTIIVTASFIEKSEILAARIHFSPAHTSDIGVHTTDAIVVVVTRIFRC